MMKATSSPRKHRGRPRTILRFLLCLTAPLPFLLTVQGLFAAPLGVSISSGDMYEFNLMTGDYWLAAQFDHPVRCGPLTHDGDTLFCTVGREFEGTWVRRLERSSSSVAWEVVFPELDFPDGIAYVDSLLYVVAHESQPRRYYLLTIDPTSGDEQARIHLPDLGIIDGVPHIPFALAPRGSELWLLRSGNGLRAHRIDPLTGETIESFELPGVGTMDDADFDPDGRLWISQWQWDIINVSWCTHYWMIPFLGAPGELQFSHCWHPPDPVPPNLAFFTLSTTEVATPAVEIPTLGAVSAGLLAVLLALVGVRVLRAR